MCTGMEVALLAGAGASAASTLMAEKPEIPKAPDVTGDADAAAAQAASAGIQQRTRQRRAMRSQSLLATGAGGDTSNVVTGIPTATKTTLGA
jgi:hypothetical protein